MGHLDGHGTFVADEVLAKHDEKYMPPEVAKSLKRRHGEAREEALDNSAATPTTGTTPSPDTTPSTTLTPSTNTQASATPSPSAGS